MSTHALARILLATTITFSASIPAALEAATPGAAPCDSIVPLEPGDSWRDPGSSAAGVAVCFDVALDRPGRLSVDLIVPATAPRAHLRPVGSRAAETLWHAATGLVLAAEAGTYRLRVAADDPAAALEPFRLEIRQAAAVPTPAKGENDSEIELEPDPFVACPGTVATKGENDSEIELEPDPFIACPGTVATKGENDSEIELEPDPFVACPGIAAKRDDHGDRFLTASRLQVGRAVAGTIANDWADDVDVFRFEVAEVAPVALRAHGDGELVATLYDRRGQRLEVAVGGADGASDSVRLARALVPGTYFVRLEGRHGAAGAYALTLD